jgi:glyoxylase-like metal-dependent hydrolase (beta-lactamase superfamily II)
VSRTILHSLRPGVWLGEVEVPGFRVRGALIVGRDRAVVWDTLSRPQDMEPFVPLLEGLDTIVVYSHADWDHAWGTAGLPAPSAVVAHRAAAERMRAEGPGELEEKRREHPSLYGDVVLVPPTVTFEREHRLDLGGLTLELRALPGHTPDSLVGLVPELGILLAGDAVETPLPLLGPEGDPIGWIQDLEAWAGDERVELVVPSHGEIGGCDLLRRTAGYLSNLTKGVLEPPLGELDAFYKDAHQRNLERARRAVGQ